MVRSWKDDVFFADQGEIYSYSSAGFWLSGFVIEEVEGKPYADAMNELLYRGEAFERARERAVSGGDNGLLAIVRAGGNEARPPGQRRLEALQLGGIDGRRRRVDLEIAGRQRPRGAPRAAN